MCNELCGRGEGVGTGGRERRGGRRGGGRSGGEGGERRGRRRVGRKDEVEGCNELAVPTVLVPTQLIEPVFPHDGCD